MLWQKIDDSNRKDYFSLESNDECFFWLEYTVKPGSKEPAYKHSQANQLIYNLKKPISRKSQHDYRYKKEAIQQCIKFLKHPLEKILHKCALIPVPPSKVKADPEYDDRMLQICQGVAPDRTVELVVQKESTQANHDGEERTSSADLIANYQIQCGVVLPPNTETIFIIDDVLTTGAHFKAMQRVIKEHCPNQKIKGVFFARCIWDFGFENVKDFNKSDL